MGGSERAVHVKAGLAPMGPDAVVLKCDFQNAFNERKREQVISDLFDEDSLQPIWRLSHWAYKVPSELLVLDNGEICASISSEQGVKQGDGLGSLLFSLSMQRLYRLSTRNAQRVRCVAVADDLNLVGPFCVPLMTSLWTFRTLASAFAPPSAGFCGPIVRNSLLISEPLPKLAPYKYSRDIWLL